MDAFPTISPTRRAARPARRVAAAGLAAGLLLAACGGDAADDATPTTNADTAAPTATTSAVNDDGTGATEPFDLEASIEAIGNPDAQVVIVNTQGGPVTELASEELADIGRLVDLDETYVVNVHQAQTLDPERFTSADVTFDEAKAADGASVQRLASVVEHYVAQDKQVYVLGISFGAFMTQELLATQGNVADGYLIMVGRLDMPEEVWSEFAQGRTAGFVGGVDIVTVPIEEAGMGAGTPAGDRNMARLAAGLGHQRYTERLAGLDLGNVVYAYGDTDEQVGRLTAAEVRFLEDAGATVQRSDGDHGGAVDEFLAAGLEQLIGTAVVAPTSEVGLPDTTTPTGADILTDASIGALVTAAGEEPFLETGFADAADLGLDADTVTGTVIYGVTASSLVAIPIDLSGEAPAGTLVVIGEAGVLVGDDIEVAEDGDFITVVGTVDDNGSPHAVAAALGFGLGTSTFEISGTEAVVRGDLGARTLRQVEYLVDNHPEVTTLVLQDIGGSVNDEVNVVTVARVRAAGLNTHVPADGEIYSGGVDLFAGGVVRTAEPGATIGVHAWCCGPNGESAHLIPQDDQAHAAQLELFTSLMGPVQGPQFYFFTLAAAPFDGIEPMTAAELDLFDLVTPDDALGTPIARRVPAAETGSATSVAERVALVVSALEAEGRSVEVLVRLDDAPSSAILSLDEGTPSAELVTLALAEGDDGWIVTDSTAQPVLGS